jgi:hypothetical protein
MSMSMSCQHVLPALHNISRQFKNILCALGGKHGISGERKPQAPPKPRGKQQNHQPPDGTSQKDTASEAAPTHAQTPSGMSLCLREPLNNYIWRSSMQISKHQVRVCRVRNVLDRVNRRDG